MPEEELELEDEKIQDGEPSEVVEGELLRVGIGEEGG